MRSLPLSLVLVSGLAAQVTSPNGLNTTEGNNVFFHFTTARRFQQIDFTNAGAPMVVQSISWRRNGGAAQNAPPRTFDFQVDMGHADFGLVSQRFDDNYITGTRTTVFNQTAVNFPDWSANLGSPGPFDFLILLSTPFIYTGRNALVIDFSYTNNSTTSGVSVDRHFTGPVTPPSGAVLGTGCVATGMNAPFSHTAYMANFDVLPAPQYGMRFRTGGTNAPASSPVIVFIDYQNQNISGVLCSTLFAFPIVTLALNADAAGVIPEINLGFPHDQSLAGGTFFSQLLAVDLGQPIPFVVSNGRQTTMPAAPTAGVLPCSYGWNTIPSNGIVLSAHFIGGGMVMLLQ